MLLSSLLKRPFLEKLDSWLHALRDSKHRLQKSYSLQVQYPDLKR